MTINSASNLFPISISKIKPNNTSATRLDISSISDLTDAITNFAWSAATFKRNSRRAKNFIQTSLMVLDVDGGCSISQAQIDFGGYNHIIGTSRNHQRNKNDITTDRFRVILFLDKPIVNSQVYKATWSTLFKKYSFIDRACSDVCRQWYPCTNIVSVNLDSLPVVAQSVSTGSTTPTVITNKRSSNTIMDSMHRGDFGNMLYQPVYDLLKPDWKSRRVSLDMVTKFITQRCTGLRRGRERINQKWLADKWSINQSTASRLIESLIKTKILRLVQTYQRGFDSNVYRAGKKLESIFKTTSRTSKPTGNWRAGNANKQMLSDIRWCHDSGYCRTKTLKFCLERQGSRPLKKMRSEAHIMAAINNWYDG